MKRVLILFLIIGSICFGGTISSVSEKGSKLSFIFTGSNKSAYQINYDSYNRLIFIEFPGSNLSTKINDKNYTSKYVEDFSTVNYGNSVGFFIKLNKNISYSTSFSGNDFVFSFNDKSTKKQYTIAIDAGHGGKDPGAIGYKKYYEKTIALSVARYLRDELKKDFNVVMTRDSDVDVYGPNASARNELQARVDVGNNANSDIFVSIHCNAFVNPAANGTQTFYYGSSYQGQRLAQSIQEKMIEANGLRDRGISTCNFYVVKHSYMPAVLIETAFITNYDEEALLSDDEWQTTMAKAIAEGINEYFSN